MSRFLLATLVTGALLFSLPVRADTLSVATLYSPPLAFEKNGEVTGFAADIVREALRRMGHEAHITIMPWKRAVFMVRFGKTDALFYAIKNKEREAWFFYPDEPLVVEATVPVKRFGDSLTISPDKFDYSGIRLGVGRGYYYGPALESFLESAVFAKVEEATTIESNFNKLIERRIDVFLADFDLVQHFLKENASHGMVEIATDADGNPAILDSADSFLVFSRETMSQEMADEFSRTLKAMKNDGTYSRYLEKYR